MFNGLILSPIIGSLLFRIPLIYFRTYVLYLPLSSLSSKFHVYFFLSYCALIKPEFDSYSVVTEISLPDSTIVQQSFCVKNKNVLHSWIEDQCMNLISAVFNIKPMIFHLISFLHNNRVEKIAFLNSSLKREHNMKCAGNSDETKYWVHNCTKIPRNHHEN